MKILLVNGYQKHDFCKGELNFSLYNIMLDKLRHNHDVQLSSVEDYNVIDERNKFLWADLIIFQFPIYWFNAPEEVFNNPAAFFDGKNVDDVLISFHKTMEFCGLKKRKTLSFHNVVKNPQFKFYKQTIEDYFLKEL